MTRKQQRKLKVRKRKNFPLILSLAVFFWIGVGFIIYFIDPLVFGAIPALFLFLFISFFLTTSLFFENSRRGLVASSFLLIFLIFRYLELGNVINLILLIGISIAVELFFIYR